MSDNLKNKLVQTIINVKWTDEHGEIHGLDENVANIIADMLIAEEVCFKEPVTICEKCKYYYFNECHKMDCEECPNKTKKGKCNCSKVEEHGDVKHCPYYEQYTEEE